VGAGIVHEGQLLRGAHGGAGEVAFLPLNPDYRRLRAASPDEAGGLMLLHQAQARPGWHDGAPTSVEELFSRAADGEQPAMELVEEESQRIAAIAASICAIVDPEAVILTGGVGANPALVARAGELINELAPFPPRSNPLRPRRTGQPRRRTRRGRPHRAKRLDHQRRRRKPHPRLLAGTLTSSRP
jgi:glucokinase